MYAKGVLCMKKKILILNLLLIIALLIGCTGDTKSESNIPKVSEKSQTTKSKDSLSNTKKQDKSSKEDKLNKQDKKQLNIKSYYPIKENTKYSYQGTGNEYASYSVYTEYTSKGKVQNRVDNGGTVLAEVIEVNDNAVTKLLSSPEYYYREGLLQDATLNARDKSKEEILLKSPIKKGNTWTLNDGRKRTITNISVDVKTPMKSYKAIEVTTEGKGQGKTIDYYVKDVGLVKTVFTSDEMEVKSELKAIDENAKLTQKIKFYYGYHDDDKMEYKLGYKEKDVDFKTNDITRQILEKTYKDVLKGTGLTALTQNTKINHLYLNKDGMVYIDLSKDFIKELNAGSGYEAIILDSIAATFGNYYNAKRVVLTIDGGNYESGHIVLGKGDYLEVKNEDKNEDKVKYDSINEGTIKDNPTKDDSNKENSNKENNAKSDIKSYYPIKDNTRYSYKGTGNEYASYSVYTAYTNKNKVQNRVDNGGTVLSEIIEVNDSTITKLLSRPETYYRESLLSEKTLNSRDKKKDEILLKAPIKKGNTWTLNDGRKRTITNVSVDVTTPLKSYKAIEVTTEGKGKGKTIDYYAKDVGLVKTVFISDGMEVKSELKSIDESAKLTQNIQFFYPDIDATNLFYKEKNVDFKTNDITREVLEKTYKNVLKDTRAIVLTKNTKINYLYLNKDGMVYIDLNKAFVKEMNAGARYEGMILQSMATTFGNYYGAKKVVLTIEGGNYESGHIILEKGDYLEVTTKGAINKN